MEFRYHTISHDFNFCSWFGPSPQLYRLQLVWPVQVCNFWVYVSTLPLRTRHHPARSSSTRTWHALAVHSTGTIAAQCFDTNAGARFGSSPFRFFFTFFPPVLVSLSVTSCDILARDGPRGFNRILVSRDLLLRILLSLWYYAWVSIFWLRISSRYPPYIVFRGVVHYQLIPFILVHWRL